jgi:uncharacterized YigZ family protein
MLILKTPSLAETRVKNSRFLAEALIVHTPEEAKELWKWRKENYDNGGHIVYAFTVGSNQNISGCSDDGEPSGTAGKPVLAVLLGSGLTNTLITIARWFGGTKLGTGGLVHAYSEAAKAAIDAAQKVELIPLNHIGLTISYALYATARKYLDSVGFTSENEEFAAEIKISGTIPRAASQDVDKFIQELGNGKIICNQQEL